MKKRLHSALAFLTLSMASLYASNAKAQSIQVGNEERTVFEVGLNIGPSFFLGDLGGNKGEGSRFIKDVNLPLTKLMVGAFVTVYPKEWLGVRVAAQLGQLEGEDKKIAPKGGDELFRKERNLDFRTKLFEAYVAAEVYPLQLLLNRYGDYNPRLLPYGVLGIGMYKYNPQGSLTDANGNKRWYDLKPLHTEGQGFPEYPDRKDYNLTQINIPMGVGVKYLLTEKMNISFEILLRKSFNDYVDDVSTTYIDPALYDLHLSPQNAAIARQISDKMQNMVSNPNVTRFSPGTQRGNPNQNDSWFTTFIKFGWKLNAPHDRQQLRRMRCPVRF